MDGQRLSDHDPDERLWPWGQPLWKASTCLPVKAGYAVPTEPLSVGDPLCEAGVNAASVGINGQSTRRSQMSIKT